MIEHDGAKRDYAALSHGQRIELLAACSSTRRGWMRHGCGCWPRSSSTGRRCPTTNSTSTGIAKTSPARCASPDGLAAGRLRESAELVTRYPATLALLEAGTITLWHALRLVEAGVARSDKVMAAVEKRVLPRAGEQSVGEFKARVTRALAALDPEHAERQRVAARDERRVVFSPRPDGTTDLWAPGLSTAEATAMAEQIRGLARQWKGLDARTGDHRQSDALVALVLGTGLADGTPTVRPTVNVVVALSTLLGLDEQPADVDGSPASAAVARALAFDANGTWRRLLTDPNGRLVDVTAETYRPPANMARLVRLQQQTCCFPGCRRRASKLDTELDHIVPWGTGGRTTPPNLQPLCARHHHLKHEAGWTVCREPDGTTVWTSRTGRRYRRPPDDLPIDTRSDPPDHDAA